MGKGKNRANRLACIMHAATDAVGVLRASGFRCLVLDEMALRLHGSAKGPAALSLAVLTINGSPSLELAIQVLLLNPDQGFIRCPSRQGTVRYVDPNPLDPSILAECDVKLTLKDARAPGYCEGEIQQIAGLPVIGLFPTVVYAMHAGIVAYGWRSTNRNPGFSKAVKKLINQWGTKEVNPIHGEDFKALALPILQNLYEEDPTFRPFVAMCRKSFITTLQVDGPQPKAPAQEAPVRDDPSLSALLDGKDAVSIHETEVKIDLGEGHWENTAAHGWEPIIESKNKRKIGSIIEEPTVRHVSVKVLVKVAKLVINILNGLEYRSAVLGGDSLYDNSAPSDHVDIMVFRPTSATPANVRKALMTSLWYQRFHIRRVVGEESLLFQLNSLAAGFDASHRSRITINIQTPTSFVGVAPAEDDIIDLPVIPSRVLQPQQSAVGVKAASRENPLRTLYDAFHDLGGYQEAIDRWYSI